MWNNRIIRKKQEAKLNIPEMYLYGVSEVYYDEKWNPNWYTEPDLWFVLPDECIEHYELIVEDIKKDRPILPIEDIQEQV